LEQVLTVLAECHCRCDVMWVGAKLS
jgi:hypothetical protein